MTYSQFTTLYRKVKADAAFVASELFSLTAGSKGNVHLENPDGSSKEFTIVGVIVNSDGAFIAKIHDSFSSPPSGGNAIEMQSLKLDSENEDNDGSATVQRGVSFTADSTHAVGVSGGGGSGASIGGQVGHTVMIVEEGREFVVDVENTASNENNYAITVIFFESQ